MIFLKGKMNPNLQSAHFHVGTCIGIKNMNSFHSQLASPCGIAFWHDTIWPPAWSWMTPHHLPPCTKKHVPPNHLEYIPPRTLYINLAGFGENFCCWLVGIPKPTGRSLKPKMAPGHVVDQGRAWRVLR